MPGSKELYGKQQFEELKELRELALTESHFKGVRRSLGKVSLGRVTALWRSEEGGSAYLSDMYLRIGERSLAVLMPRTLAPTCLHIRDSELEAEGLLGVTTFSMNLHPSHGFIDVYHRMLIPGSVTTRDMLKIAFSSLKERKLELAAPTEEDLALLHDEMERGASGAYALTNLYEN